MTGLLLAVVIAFIYSWLLTLVVLGLVPFLIVAGGIHTKAVTSRVSKSKKFVETSGKIVVDSTSNIRTVASLTAEENFFRQYHRELSIPYKWVRVSDLYNVKTTYSVFEQCFTQSYQPLVKYSLSLFFSLPIDELCTSTQYCMASPTLFPRPCFI